MSFKNFQLKIENSLIAFTAYLHREIILKALEAFNQLVATERWGATDIAFLPTNDDFDPKYVDCRYTYVDSNFQGCPPTKGVQNPVEILPNLWVSQRTTLMYLINEYSLNYLQCLAPSSCQS